LIFIGANESGKSNFLKAISLLKKGVKVGKDDIRDSLPDEDHITESYVRFVFQLDDEELDGIFQKVLDQCYGITADTFFVSSQGKDSTFKQFARSRNEGLLTIDLIKETRIAQYWSLMSSNYKLNPRIKRFNGKIYTASQLLQESKNSSLKFPLNVKYVLLEENVDILPDYLTTIEAQDIYQEIGLQISKLIDVNLPDCIAWEYNEQNLLPGRIDINEFKETPTICNPLYNMFRMAGHGDIKKSIDEAELKKNGLRNLLNKVAETATRHIRLIWKEKKDIEIFLSQNGIYIEAGIKDEFNIFDFSRRSEGFKRFVTFLTMISSLNKSEAMKDDVIIIDEPDLGLHPSGAKSLRDELLKISKTNTVFYSTHSIYMIDKEKIDRHIIVKKEKEITTIEVDKKADILDEEVLYNAIGTSLFDILKEDNLIFEGWRDKEFFRKSLGKFDLTSKFKNIGVCHSNGVKDIEAKSGLIEIVGRRFLILTDSDPIAQEKFKMSGYKKQWHSYAEVHPGMITYEDYLEDSYILSGFEKAVSKHSLPPIAINAISLPTTDKINFCKSLLHNSSVEKPLIQSVMNDLKDILIEDLKPSYIQDSYKEYLIRILEWMKA
jgi:AAA15 family ATPase/GTPase